MSHSPHLLVLGELCADIIVTLDRPVQFEQVEQVVPSARIVMGSSSAITACGVARLGVPVSMIGVVGMDMLGHFVLDELRARGVDVTATRLEPDLPTGTSTILTRPDGDRAILTALGSIGHTSVQDVPESLLSQTAHLHVGSYFLQHALHDNLAELFAMCRDRGISTSLDPNYDPSEKWDSGITSVIPHTDVFFCNKQEALLISRTDSIQQSVDWFALRLPHDAELVVKAGAVGASVYQARDSRAGQPISVIPEPDQRPLADTVGAGDSLAAGYLAARLRGLDLPTRLQVGVRNGTASTREFGGTLGQLAWPEATAAR
jgi:sugar/nucleoside kinase (ribokinase family)